VGRCRFRTGVGVCLKSRRPYNQGDLESISKPMLKTVPPDERAAESKDCVMRLLQLFVPAPPASPAVQPCSGALPDPAVAPPPRARGTPPPREAGRSASAAPLLAPGARVIRLVRVQLRGAPARSASPLTYWRQGGHAAQPPPRLVSLGPALHDRQRQAWGCDHQRALRARCPSIRRIRAGWCPPCGAGPGNDSTAARRHARWSASARRARRPRGRGCQPPACGPSRRRRQQVAPAPQPLSRGTQAQGSPVRRPKLRPRSPSGVATRGRPPGGGAGAGGRRGSRTAPRSSRTRGLAIRSAATKDRPPWPRF
jgi:hypothetical protein